MGRSSVSDKIKCYHCGEFCRERIIEKELHSFCCEGCCMVYSLLSDKGLDAYYQLDKRSGLSLNKQIRAEKFDFLDLDKVEMQLITFKNETETHINFQLPQIHCSSCLYLLENLPKINASIRQCIINFPQKKAQIIFDHRSLPLRELVMLLSKIGYEPQLALDNLAPKKPVLTRQLRYQLGVAAFCFGNIMLLSFPEYLGLSINDGQLLKVFRWLSLVLSLPLISFAALPFLKSGWEGIKNRYLNIDAPIALAIIVTFTRSCFEIFAGTGSGYLDSLSGIVLFMLIGRVLQNKIYQELSFDRDYKSYFPIAATKVTTTSTEPVPLPDIKVGDTLRVYDNELIAVDGIITKGSAMADYGFVTGESIPVPVETGQSVYAGGKISGGSVEILAMKAVEQSYLTSLWSRNSFKKKNTIDKSSFVHLISRYFTYIVLDIAICGALYWFFKDSSQVFNVVTAVLIVACPCALLLSSTFTNAYILKILGLNRFYLRSAQVIEDIANADHIAFDKTGTLTSIAHNKIVYHGVELSFDQQCALTAIAAESGHPVSRAISKKYKKCIGVETSSVRSYPGQGISGLVSGKKVMLGSYEFIHGYADRSQPAGTYVSFDGLTAGYFELKNQYRRSINSVLKSLSARYELSIISGDNDKEESTLRGLTGENTMILFRLSPQEKLQYIRDLQARNKRVIMLGDGLNDAGALMESETGIAITEDRNNFTPASDAILDATSFAKLPAFLRLCRTNKKIVKASFIVSIVYNVIGLSFALSGTLSPVFAAVLMPASSITIVLLTYSATHVAASRAGLRIS
jgi:Cu+-exporting ATPase